MEISYRFLDTKSKSDISQWLKLYSVCFQQDITKTFWNNIFLENPFYTKTKPLIFIAETKGKIVGSFSAIPSPLVQYHKETIYRYNSLLLCKGMVHPDYRKHGIFGTLLKNAMATAGSEEYDFLLTISDNFISYQSFIRAGFYDVAAMRWSRLFLSENTVFSAYINGLHLPRIVKKFLIAACTYVYAGLVPRNNHQYQIKHGDASEFIEKIEHFYASPRRDDGIYGSRSLRFTQWKFDRKDARSKCFTISEKGIMLGYALVQLKEKGKNAYIIDIGVYPHNKAVITELIGEITTFLKENNFNAVWSYMVENDTILSTFFTFRNGFFIRSSKGGKLKKSKLLGYPLKKILAQASCLDENAWNIQAVDTCLFLE